MNTYSFSGHLVQPVSWNNISVILAGVKGEHLGMRFASAGCGVMRLDDCADRCIRSAIEYVYRFSECIILVGVLEEAEHVLSYAGLDSIDSIISFDPQSVPDHLDEKIRIFSSCRMQGTTEYEPHELERLLYEQETCALWDKLAMMVQFL